MLEKEDDIQFEKDKELQMLAARAAGIEIEPCTCSNRDWPFRVKGGISTRGHWNPLISDGDAFKIAAKLKMEVRFLNGAAYAEPLDGCDGWIWEHGEDVRQAARRAICRAAALMASPLNPA
ncbi:hypothetical protein [Pseudomonas sp. PS02290]|uniref:hypothetical protein n=1 Tax=Pseudomonas sp. PS02290 TaxID=2991430 RepID=UPI00249BD2A1|nr:hypothetical protein [Pseudomonas sp. PS02290]